MPREEPIVSESVESQVLQLRAWVESRYRSFWKRYDSNDFQRFQKALVTFYQDVRVYIEKTDGYEDLIEEMDKEVCRGGKWTKVPTGEDVQKWVNYYNEINSALFDAGILDISSVKGIGSSDY